MVCPLTYRHISLLGRGPGIIRRRILTLTFQIQGNCDSIQCRPLSSGRVTWQGRRSTFDGTCRARPWPRTGSVTSSPGSGSSSTENTRLTEVITIYEKLTKSRDREAVDEGNNLAEDVFRPSSNYFDYLRYGDRVDQSRTGFWNQGFQPDGGGGGPAAPTSTADQNQSPKVLDFSKFRNSLGKNYSYFSAKTGLLQSHTLDTLTWDGPGVGAVPDLGSTSTPHPTTPLNCSSLILESKQFCLSIVNPTEKDLTFLGTQLNVHDLTLRDIREQNTEEKVEVFKHYTFLSLRPYLDTGVEVEKKQDPQSSSTANIDLNILLFPEFAIIVHYGHHWSGLKDMLGFLNLLCSYGNSPLSPDWVLFSIFIELAQDAKYSVKSLEPRILSLKVAESISDAEDASGTEKDRLSSELSNVLTKNFENEFEIYKINRFIKPKIKVLKVLRVKCANRVGGGVLNLLSGTRKEFEELGEALGHFSHILERSQDTCLTLANVRQSHEANTMGQSMKRISEVALFFLPLQALAGFLGMNVRVPFQDLESTGPFWGIILSSGLFILVLIRVSKGAFSGIVKKSEGTVGVDSSKKTNNLITKFQQSQMKK